MHEPHQYKKISAKNGRCRDCGGNRNATFHMQWLDQQDALERKLSAEKMDEHFGDTPDFRIGNVTVYACLKCGALVPEDSLATHVDWHTTEL